MDELKTKVIKLTQHLKAAQALVNEIEKKANVGFCLWLDRVQLTHGLEMISRVTGREIAEENPYGDETVEDVVNVDGIKFFTLRG
jgi:hypothetical protein